MLWEVLRNHDTGSITWLLVYHLVAVLKEFMVKPKNRKATVQKDLYSKRKGLFCCIHECIPSFCKAWFLISSHIIIEFSSVAQSCSTPCDPMNCSTPGLPVHHQLLESTQTTVHWVGDAIQPSHPLSSPSPPGPIPPSIRVFSNESALHIRWSKYWSFSFNISPSNEHSGLTSLGWADWISLQIKGRSRVFSYNTVKKHQFFSACIF